MNKFYQQGFKYSEEFNYSDNTSTQGPLSIDFTVPSNLKGSNAKNYIDGFEENVKQVYQNDSAVDLTFFPN